MKRFLAIYLGSATGSQRAEWDRMDAAQRKAQEAAGIEAWFKWGNTNKAAIVDTGAPLGKTKSVSKKGISDTRNLLTGYVIIEADSHEAAARLFENHPHFAIFPGEAVEIMECLPMPRQQ